MANADQEQQTPPEPQKRLNPFQVIGSVIAAAFGVQSSRNRERDFSHGSFGPFIAAGIIFTILFIGALYLVVSTVLSGR
ncbi:MAG: DUF2970 domain-containing protein [Halieaceae bacterium]|nr:DUF2970 domain-containing protein [Halieaceae bacterium]